MKKSTFVGATSLVASLLLQLSMLRYHAHGAAGDVDLSFDPGSGVNGSVTAVALQADGKAIIGGSFSTVRNLARTSVARLNTDGSGDSSFTLVSGYNYSTVRAITLQPDGKVLVGHYYGVARHNTDGSVDTNFNAALYSDYSYYDLNISSLAVQPDGKVLVGGYLATVGTNVNFGIARLHPDGSLDTNFNAGLFSEFTYDTLIYSIAVQPDGKVLVGGYLATVNGTNYCYGIARLHANGSLDNTFDAGTGADSAVTSVVVQPDGKVILGGAFSKVNGTSRYRIARLNAGGSLDSSFNPVTVEGSMVDEVVLQADGKVLIGGNILTVNGAQTNYGIARLNANGSLDTSFNPGPGANGGVYAIAPQSDGKVLIGGSFTTVNGTNRNYMARLDANGSLDTRFFPGRALPYPGAYLEVQPDGKVLVSGARLNPDGSLDNTYVPVQPTNNPNFNPDISVPGTFYSIAECTAVQTDGKVLIGGYAYSEYYDPEGGYYPIYSYFLYRFNSDGNRDPNFEPALGNQYYYDIHTIRMLVIQPDGKILVNGRFYDFKGTTRNGIARLNANGTLDSNFNPGLGGAAFFMKLQPDGRLLVGNGAGLVWLNGDGSRDPCFNPAFEGYLSSLAVALQPDGRMLVGGSFSAINGVSRNGIARLNSNGSLDTSFDPGTGANGTVTAIAVQPDGKVLIAGNFVTVNGIVRPYVARLFGGSSVPRLRLFPTGNNALTVAWPSPSTGFALQQNTNVATPNWVNSTAVPTTVGLENQVAVSAPAGQRFFRLFSNATNAPPPSPPAPPAPAPQVTATAGDGRVLLSWTTFPGATGHHVQRATNYNGPYTTIAHPSSTNYTDTAAANGATYYYIVSVIYPCGESLASYSVGATPYRSVRVQSITMSFVAKGPRYETRAVVKLVDNSGTPFSGATVTGNFTGSINNAGRTGVTAGNGEATITSSSAIKNGTVTFTMIGVAAGTVPYNPDANIVTAATISR